MRQMNNAIIALCIKYKLFIYKKLQKYLNVVDKDGARC